MGTTKPFTREEREKIVKFLMQQKNYASFRGNKIWQIMEEKKIIDRTWQSMKYDFKKKIIMELHTYRIPENDVILMRRGMMKDSWKAKSEYVSTYHGAKNVLNPTHDYTLREPMQVNDDIIVISDDEVEFISNKELTINETVKTREKRRNIVDLLNKSVGYRLSKYRQVCGINDSEYFSPENPNATQKSDSGDINEQAPTNMQHNFADSEIECSPIAPQIENIEKTKNNSKQFVPNKRFLKEVFLTSSQDVLHEEHSAAKKPKKIKRNMKKNLFCKNESDKNIVAQDVEIVNTSSKSSSFSREENTNERQNCKGGGHFSRKETLKNLVPVSIPENFHNDCITSNKVVEDSKENGENNRSKSSNEENVSSKNLIDVGINKLVVNYEGGGHFSRKETLKNVVPVSIPENFHNDCITSNKIVEDSKEYGENNRSKSSNEENISSKNLIDVCINKLVVESSSSSRKENKDERHNCKDDGHFSCKGTLENIGPVGIQENFHNDYIPSNKIVEDHKSILREHMIKEKSENGRHITHERNLKNSSDPSIIIVHDSDSESDMLESPEENVKDSRASGESLLSAEEQGKLLFEYFSSNNLYDKKEDISVYQAFHKLHPNTFAPEELKNKFVHKINRKVDEKSGFQPRNAYEIFRESRGIKCQFLAMNLNNELHLFVEKCDNVERDVEKLIEILEVTLENTYILDEFFFSRIRSINDMRNNILEYLINGDSFLHNSNLIQNNLQHCLDEIENMEYCYSCIVNLNLLLNKMLYLGGKLANSNNEYSGSFMDNLNLLQNKFQHFFSELVNTDNIEHIYSVGDDLNLLLNNVQHLLGEIENIENRDQNANNPQAINYETSTIAQNDSLNSIRKVANSDNSELESCSSENLAITSQDADRTLKLQQLRNDIEFILTHPISNDDIINTDDTLNDFSNMNNINLGKEDTSISELNIPLNLGDSDNTIINLIRNETEKHLIENPIPEDISACKYKYEESLDISNTSTIFLNEAEKKCCSYCQIQQNRYIETIVLENSENSRQKMDNTGTETGNNSGTYLSTNSSCSFQTGTKQNTVDKTTKQLNNSQKQENVLNDSQIQNGTEDVSTILVKKKTKSLPKNFQEGLQISNMSSDHNNIERSAQEIIAKPLSLNLSENNSKQTSNLAIKSFNNNTMYILSSDESVSENTEDLSTGILHLKNTQKSQELFNPENINPPASQESVSENTQNPKTDILHLENTEQFYSENSNPSTSQETVFSENFIPLTVSTPKPEQNEEETLSSTSEISEKLSCCSEEIPLQQNLKFSLLNASLENANQSNVSSFTEILTQIEQKLNETDSDRYDTLLDVLITEEMKSELNDVVKEENITHQVLVDLSEAGEIKQEQNSKTNFTQEEQFLTCASQFYTCEDDT